jgi:molecular chaperone GrpE
VAENKIDEELEKSNETEEASVEQEKEQEKVQQEAFQEESQEETQTGEDADAQQSQKDKKDLKIEELNDRYIRTMAEFDNYRKRTDKEKSAMYEIGAKDVVEKILPVVDNFERGFAALTEEEKTTPFADGMDRVYKQLMKAFEELGVKEIEAVGKEFDPALHNAVMHVEDESFGENVVCEEFQKGYTYRESVVRHSMVKVAN